LGVMDRPVDVSFLGSTDMFVMDETGMIHHFQWK